MSTLIYFLTIFLSASFLIKSKISVMNKIIMKVDILRVNKQLMLKSKQIVGINIDAASVVNHNLLFVVSLEDMNVHSAKKVWRPKKVMTKPMNLKSFNESCGATNGISR